MRHPITVTEYEQMTFDSEERVELIRGEILPMSPIGDFHAGIVTRLNRLLMRKAGQHATINVQNPTVMPDSEPQPDLTILRYRDDDYVSGKPRAADVWLVTEVSDSTLPKDRHLKGPLYAEMGIPEYWIVNLVDDCLEVYRQPQLHGYDSLETLRAGDIVAIPGLQNETLDVSLLFPS